VLVAGNTPIWAAMMKDMSVRSLAALSGNYGQRLHYFLFWDVSVKGMNPRSFTVCWRCMHRRGKPDLIGQSKANNPRGNSYANAPFWNGTFTHLDIEYFHAMCVYYGRSIM
jgi:hypothetical protein